MVSFKTNLLLIAAAVKRSSTEKTYFGVVKTRFCCAVTDLSGFVTACSAFIARISTLLQCRRSPDLLGYKVYPPSSKSANFVAYPDYL